MTDASINYMEQVEAFFQRLQEPQTSLKSNSIGIYFVLLLIQKRAGKEIFKVSYGEVLQLTGIASPTTYYSCIQQLHDNGYIFFTPGSAMYTHSTVQIVRLREAKTYDTDCKLR